MRANQKTDEPISRDGASVQRGDGNIPYRSPRCIVGGLDGNGPLNRRRAGRRGHNRTSIPCFRDRRCRCGGSGGACKPLSDRRHHAQANGKPGTGGVEFLGPFPPSMDFGHGGRDAIRREADGQPSKALNQGLSILRVHTLRVPLAARPPVFARLLGQPESTIEKRWALNPAGSRKHWIVLMPPSPACIRR